MSRILIACFILLLLDLYAFKGIALLARSLSVQSQLIIKIIYWLVSFVVLFQVYSLLSNYNMIRFESPYLLRFWSAVFFVFLFSKLGFSIFHIVDDISWLFQKGINFFKTPKPAEGGEQISRGLFITQLGLGVSAILFGSYGYGVTKGKYAFKVFKEKIKFPNLPKAFDGLRIVQISDLHLGSFNEDFDEVSRAIDMINELDADYIFFTGDLVNVHSDEAEPWIETFSKLKSKYGNYSVFGNHDYCDYADYPQEERAKSVKRLKEIHSEMGFRLLEDEHIYLERSDEKIALIGMHNWGHGFHEIGDLEKSIVGLDDEVFQILLSHDPTCWEEKVKGKKAIDLTLAGHTHGMQMGVEIPLFGIKWSPINLRYKNWAGHYSEGNNHIYINRGLGFLGFPGRVGIKPEITLLELVS